MQKYLVGGAVRDKLLGRPVTERDWVVVGASPEELIALGYTQVGKDFPVFLHPETQEEYALARTERKTGGGYTGFTCFTDRTVTLKEDLLRRDLTVNAMAQTDDGQLIDPYNGQNDLDNRLLRHVSAAFSEDPLRVFRVARFAARYAYLGFSIAPETQALMAQMSENDDITQLSAERVWQETRRSLMESSPEVYFQVLNDCGALARWMPELSATLNTDKYALLKRSADHNLSLPSRWAAACFSLSDTATSELNQRLKVPNVEADVAVLANKVMPDLATKITNSEAILSVFDTSDAWRRPERLNYLLELIPVFYPQNDSIAQILNLALDEANETDVKAILAAGFKGPAIKQQLTEQRLERITQLLQNHSVNQK